MKAWTLLVLQGKRCRRVALYKEHTKQMKNLSMQKVKCLQVWEFKRRNPLIFTKWLPKVQAKTSTKCSKPQKQKEKILSLGLMKTLSKSKNLERRAQKRLRKWDQVKNNHLKNRKEGRKCLFMISRQRRASPKRTKTPSSSKTYQKLKLPICWSRQKWKIHSAKLQLWRKSARSVRRTAITTKSARNAMNCKTKLKMRRKSAGSWSKRWRIRVLWRRKKRLSCRTT